MNDHGQTIGKPVSGDGMAGDTGGGGLGLLVGVGISIVLSAALVIPAAKAGITPGVSPLVVLVGWVAFGAVLGPRLKRFLAIAQVTGSAGASVTAGVVFTAPILQVLAGTRGLEIPPVDVPVLTVASLAGALLGFGFVGLATRRFLTDPRLPAPEAVACDRLIATAVENPEERPRISISLIPGLLSGFVVNALLSLGWFRDGEEVGEVHANVGEGGQGGPFDLTLPLPMSPLYLGIGALLTLPTGLLLFGGGLVNATTTGYSAAEGMPPTTFRWVGGAAMVVAVLYSLIDYVIEGRKQAGAAVEQDETLDESLLEIPPRARFMLIGSIIVGMALLLVMMGMVGASMLTLVIMGGVALVLASLLSSLGGLLSLQVGSSASPVSGTVFVGMLVLSLTALAVGLEGMAGVAFLVPIVVGTCVAICAANDSSQDYKTMQLNRLPVREGFNGQLLGLLGGALTVPLVLSLAHTSSVEAALVAGTQGGLGSPDLAVPQAGFFATVLDSLFLAGETPWGPIGVGALLGAVAVGLEIVGKRRGLILSSLAFAVGIYLPSEIGTGILIGALARFLATRQVSSSTHGGILTAAGLITGYAFAALVHGLLIIGLGAELVATWVPGVAKWAPSETLGPGVGKLLLGAMLALVLFNYIKPKRAAAA